MSASRSVILLVDDEPSSLKMLSDALSGQGFSLAVAMSGERMLEQVQRRVPDLILLDVLMPGMDGFEVLQRLKANPATKDVPVLFMTSLHEATDRIHGLELGAADFLTKPVDRAELLARINIQLTLRDAIRSLVTKNQELELARAELAATAEELRREKDALDFELKERLRQSQRLDSLGRLAGGVAHDFNNLLSVILGTADFLGLGMDQDDPRREDIDAIIDAAERGSKLTRQLLAVGRQQHGTLQRADVHALLQETEPLLARVLGEDVELELQLEARHGCVVIDASQLEQVVLNLASNARQAIRGDGGQFVLATRSVTLTADAGRELELAPGEYLELRAIDNGEGIAPEHRAHIFEPFFTTKDAAHGSGLGLATIYGIVRLAKGHVRVDSEVGQGTCFTILWPEVTREAQIEAQVELEPTQPPSVADGTRILLVDDDQAVRRTVAKILEHGGYQVLTAEGPSAALELAREGLHVDLIVTDVVMPKMSGPAMIEWLGTLLGSRPVVFMSGYASAAQSKLGGHPGFLPKPFTPGQLLAKVRAQLGG